MKVYRSISEISLSSSSALTIGNFDGVHLGHQEILRYLLKKSAKLSLESLVLSFYPSPSCKLYPDKFNGHIDSDVEKIEKLRELNIDKFLIMKFDDDIRKMSADIFLSEIIIKKLNPSVVIVGYDHHFGYKREGDYDFLNKNKSKYGYELLKVDEKFLNEKKISSSIIRKMIADSNMKGAATLLGRPYQLNGKVITGDGVGKSLGFPTANIEINSLKILPGRGVYFVKVINENAQQFYGMCNIGTKPTFKKNKKIYCEVNIFNFNENIYNSNLKIEFIDFIRLEKKFESISSLKKQLISDKNKCLEYSYNNV